MPGRFWLMLGLTLTLAGGATVTGGYLAERDARARPVTVKVTPPQAKPVKRAVVKQPAATKPAANAKQPAKPVVKPSATKPTPAVVKPAPAVVATGRPWRNVIWWGIGALAVGVAAVAHSLRDYFPKPPRTGADEMLNDAPPF